MSEPTTAADLFWADVHLLADAVLAEVKYSEWVATGGTDGCAQCSPAKGDSLTFEQRIERGHLRCAKELAFDKGARGIRESLICGGLNARLARTMEDPRFGAWLKTTKETP